MIYTKYMFHVGLSTPARFNRVIAEQMADGVDPDLRLTLTTSLVC